MVEKGQKCEKRAKKAKSRNNKSQGKGENMRNRKISSN
jgi:hypothetical protein